MIIKKEKLVTSLKKILALLVVFVLACGCGSVKSNFDYEKLLWTAAWSPDDELIAIGGIWGEMQLISSDNLQVVEAIKIPHTITKIKWHPNGRLIAVASQITDAPSLIINIETGAKISLSNLAESGARGLAWNHDGSLLAVGDNEGWVTLFDVAGRFVTKVYLEQKIVADLSWHPFKNKIVAVGSQISIYDFKTSTLKTIQPRSEEVLLLSTAWHKSGDFFVTGDYGDYVKELSPLLQFWNAEGENIRNIKKSKAEYRNLKWSDNGKMLATASDRVRTWNSDGKILKDRSIGSLLWGIDWNSDGSKLVVTSKNGEIVVLDNRLKVLKRKLPAIIIQEKVK